MKQFAPLIFQCIKYLTFQAIYLYSHDQVKFAPLQKKKHFKEKLLNKTVSSSKILHNFFFHIKWVIRARNGLPPPVPTIQFGCVTAAFPATADTAVLFAVTAEDGRISIFPHPFSTLVLCLQFPLCCMIISSTPLCLTITIPSFSLSFPFLLFLFTWVHLHSITGFLS